MKTRTRPALILVFLLSCLAPAAHAEEPAGKEVREVLRLAIARGAPLFNERNYDACAAVYEVAAASVLLLGTRGLSGSEARGLKEAMDRAGRVTLASERAWVLRCSFDMILGDEGFRVRREAPLPAGFPEPGPLGEAVEKEYPRYRLARAEAGDERSAFWTLFAHIRKYEIPMTAPVEMTMADEDGVWVRRDMSFLYERPDVGEAGKDGRVDVLDAAPMLSCGFRGPLTQEKMRAAREAIEARLGEALIRDGDLRLLGYNSPMVPANRRFFEIQLPVRKTDQVADDGR